MEGGGVTNGTGFRQYAAEEVTSVNQAVVLHIVLWCVVRST